MAKLLNKAMLTQSAKRTFVFHSLRAVYDAVILWVANLGVHTKDTDKTFPMTAYDTFSFDDIVKAASQIKLIMHPHEAAVLELWPEKVKQLLSDAKECVGKVGGRLVSKVRTELNPNIMFRTSHADDAFMPANPELSECKKIGQAKPETLSLMSQVADALAGLADVLCFASKCFAHTARLTNLRGPFSSPFFSSYLWPSAMRCKNVQFEYGSYRCCIVDVSGSEFRLSGVFSLVHIHFVARIAVAEDPAQMHIEALAWRHGGRTKVSFAKLWCLLHEASIAGEIAKLHAGEDLPGTRC